MGSRPAARGAQRVVRDRDDPGRELRARVWRYVFECHEKKKAGEKARADREAKGAGDDRPDGSTL